MQLSRESAPVRWGTMVAAWALAAVLLSMHASIVHDYIDIMAQLGLRGGTSVNTPLQQPYPAFAADAQTWVRHALSLLEGDAIRLRHTEIDNAPHGREVHWNSAWAWTIAGAGWLHHWLNRIPLPRAVEMATLWLNPVVLSLLTIVLSAAAARRAGLLAGLIVTMAMVGHPRIFEGFFPGYVDHHGLVATAAFGLVLGAVFMGAGWWRKSGSGGVELLPVSPEQARAGAMMSALSGAFGMWVTAASIIPPIAIVGVAGLFTIVAAGRTAAGQGVSFDGATWRTWGRVGGAASFIFYLIEYFPNHLGFRLESNHPFHSLAWWGGAELIAAFGERWLASPAERWRGMRKLALPAAALMLAPLTILFGGAAVFLVSDPFLARLHHDYIQEFLPLWRSIRGTGWRTFMHVVGLENVPVIVAVVTLVFLRRRAPLILWFAAAAGLLLTSMAWVQSRWLLNASGAQVTTALILCAVFFGRWRLLPNYAVCLIIGGLLFFPHAIYRVVSGKEDVKNRRVAPKDAQMALSRDIAAAILRSQPRGQVTLLTSPNSSTSVGYFGRFKTLGTLYWENTAGLKAAAAILAAQTQDEAATLIKKHGVTHIAMISEENFIVEYYRLLNPGATNEQVQKSFGHQILFSRTVPPWLQMLPYKVPDDLAALNITVMLFKVAFEQTPADALYHVALAKVAMGTLGEAEADFDTLIRLSPDSHQPYLRKGELLYLKHDFDGAVEFTIKGIELAPAAQRSEMYGNAASSFYRERKYAQAVRIYRAALAARYDPELAAYLAFILATAKDDQVRDGKAALELATRALQANPNSTTLLNSYAVALAENGRFEDAVVAAKRAAANAKLANDAQGERVSLVRMEAFAAGKPWRD